MAKITIEKFDSESHPNHMWYIDDSQAETYHKTKGLVPYYVCQVKVCGFTFIFHSVMQLELCLEYYSKKIHPTSKLPVYTENLGGDHWETQRWFDKLPLHLQDKAKRPKVVAALEKALKEYSKYREANTGKPKPNLYKY